MFEHFVAAQDLVYTQVVGELAAGQKRTHWMWYVFPQLRGLGSSDLAIRFGLADLSEAKAYLAHPVLGPRLVECTGLMLRHATRSARDILGPTDDLKFRSSMTLFAHAAGADNPYREALQLFYSGAEDPLTLARIGEN